MRVMILSAAAAALLAGCAADGAVAPRGPDPAAERGQAFAQRRCAGCHVVGLDDWGGASGPRFRDLRRRFNVLSLQKRFATISEHGSGEMPPIQISGSEAEDLIAYIESLDER